jgi:hypothetical protein
MPIYKRDGVSDQTDVRQGTLDLLIMSTIALELAVEVSKWERLSAAVNLVLHGT